MINSTKLSVSALVGAVLAFYILLVFELAGFDLSAFLLSMM
jgi:hypothetical protein